jgi:hypothetical protein
MLRRVRLLTVLALAFNFDRMLQLTGHFVLQAALVEMNDSALTIDQLDALSRAVPDDTERKDIRLYLQVTCSHAADHMHLSAVTPTCAFPGCRSESVTP